MNQGIVSSRVSQSICRDMAMICQRTCALLQYRTSKSIPYMPGQVHASVHA